MSLTTEPSVEILHVPGVGGTSPYDQAERPASVLSMEGRRVFKFGVNAICTSVTELAREAGVAVEDIDHFVFHQANERILSSAVSRLGIDDAKVTRSLAETGNISSACVPLALDRLVRAGKLIPGQLVALVGFGAGLDTGAALALGVAPPTTCHSEWRPPGRRMEKERSTHNGRPEHL